MYFHQCSCAQTVLHCHLHCCLEQCRFSLVDTSSQASEEQDSIGWCCHHVFISQETHREAQQCLRPRNEPLVSQPYRPAPKTHIPTHQDVNFCLWMSFFHCWIPAQLEAVALALSVKTVIKFTFDSVWKRIAAINIFFTSRYVSAVVNIVGITQGGGGGMQAWGIGRIFINIHYFVEFYNEMWNMQSCQLIHFWAHLWISAFTFSFWFLIFEEYLPDKY